MEIPEKNIKRLNNLFDTLTIIANGNYVYVTDIEYNYSRWSQSAIEYFDLPDNYVYDAGNIWLEYVHEDDKKKYKDSINAIFAGKEKFHEMQYRAKNANGEYVAVTCIGTILCDVEGVPKYFCGTIKNHDKHSFIDISTGYRNIYGFFDDLQGIINTKKSKIIALIGVNQFANINYVYGYNAGNQILRDIGKMLQNSFGRKSDIYRMEGAKYALVIDSKTKNEVKQIYEQLQNDITRNYSFQNNRLHVSLNGGAIELNDFNISTKTLYFSLKYTNYESKNNHCGRLNFIDDSISEDSKFYLERLNCIHNCITENCKGFFLCYQPLINAKTGKLKGAEALIRFRNEKYGVVPPIQFIPILEQDPLFSDLGLWILRQAMTDGKKILESYPEFIMNVNISYVQLESGTFINDIFALLNETKFPAKNLCLEITERCRLLDNTLLKNTMDTFKNSGIQIALDDFGTGYSSFGLLRSIPVDTIKVDREYVKNIETNDSDKKTVLSVVSIARMFDSHVCIEGVETEKMTNILKECGVNTLQGYHFSKPIEIDSFCERYCNNK